MDVCTEQEIVRVQMSILECDIWYSLVSKTWVIWKTDESVLKKEAFFSSHKCCVCNYMQYIHTVMQCSLFRGGWCSLGCSACHWLVFELFQRPLKLQFGDFLYYMPRMPEVQLQSLTFQLCNGKIKVVKAFRLNTWRPLLCTWGKLHTRVKTRVFICTVRFIGFLLSPM